MEAEEFGYAGEADVCEHTDTTERTVFNSNGGIKKVTICDECGRVVNPS